jgi:fimbrial chaperone protein
MAPRLTRPLAAIAVGWVLACGGAYAASLQISPVGIRLAAGQRASAITLQNMGAAPIYGQVRVYLWEQRDGEDVLTPTRELLASPPIVQIASQSSQAIRLVLASAAARTGEQAYRVLIDELAAEGDTAGKGVDIRLRYSVPVFLAPPIDGGRESLDWRVFRRDGQWMLRVRNNGQLHAQIGALSLSNPAGARFDIGKGLFGYVLAGCEREWRLPVDPKADLAGNLTARVVINARPAATHAVGSE